ncbi:MAG: hypothetical protein ACAH80_12235 [Alphaproteobacteria bacterium]
MNGLGKGAVIKSLGGENEDLLIEAQAPVAGAGPGVQFRQIAFRASRIDYVYEAGDGLSAIKLLDGVTIPVAMHFGELKNRIYNNDFRTGGSIDLSLVTGPTVKDKLFPRLSKEFNPAAEDAPAPATDTDLAITMFVHAKPDDRHFKLVTLAASNISHFEPHSQRKDKETYVALKRPVEGLQAFYVNMPITHFAYYLDNAKKSGETTLQLGEVTRPKDTSTLRFE